MLERHFLQPEAMWKRIVGGHHRYSSIVAVRGAEHAFIYLAGQTARDPRTGEIVGKGDMRAQIRQTYENIRAGLECAGASFGDIVRKMTFTTDVDEYYRCSNLIYEEYFTSAPPTSTLLGISRLGSPEMLVEVQVEAIIEADRLRV